MPQLYWSGFVDKLQHSPGNRIITYLPIYLFTYLPIYPFTYLPIYPFTHLPIYPFTYLPIYLFIDEEFAHA